MKTTILIATIVLALSSTAAAATPKRLPFIDVDFERALTEAKQRKLPLFVDVWAPW